MHMVIRLAFLIAFAASVFCITGASVILLSEGATPEAQLIYAMGLAIAVLAGVFHYQWSIAQYAYQRRSLATLKYVALR